MNMLKVILPIILAACAVPVMGAASSRSVPANAEVQTVSVSFNNEVIKGFYLLIDTRTSEEKAIDSGRGHPAGPVIVFFQGHAQRPDDAFEFTSKLALLSRSGMVVIPVCDTPYGTKYAHHGDKGKDVILMEIVRHVLARQGMHVLGYAPITGLPVLIEGTYISPDADKAQTRLVSIGWSHGGILARRFAHAHKASVQSLGQVCPAGYEHWGAWGVTGRFALESLRIMFRMGNGNPGMAFRSAWGFTKGFAGDFFRSIPDAVVDLHPGKLRRIFKDIHDCSMYCDSTRFHASHLEHISVIFGRDDSCMSPQRQLGIREVEHISSEDIQRFRQTFFSDVKGEDGKMNLRILPGTHLAPVIHSDLYSRTILSDLGELAH